MARPTIYDVAQKAGVSTATVSFAFRQPHKIRPTTRELVLAAAEELGYVPSAAARGLARGRTGVFGLFSFDMLISERQGLRRPVEQPHDPLAFPLYRDEVQRGLELGCWEAGYSLLLGSSAEKHAISELAGRVDGLAVFPGLLPDSAVERAAKRVPVVLLSREAIGGNTYGVAVDNAAGIDAVVEHMVVEHGARTFEYIGELRAFDFAERFKAMQQSLAARGLPVPHEPLDQINLADASYFDGIERRRMQGTLPDVLLCASDQLALEVLRQLQETGVRVPEDVKLSGFDGILAAAISSPSLTTVTQPFEEIGRAAIAMLKTICEGGEVDKQKVFPVHFTPRESCGCRGEALL